MPAECCSSASAANPTSSTALLEEIPEALRGRVRTLRAQSAGDEIEEGLALVDALVATASLARRQAVGLGELVLGLKCGGSDGFSGLTANPLVGRMADRVTGAGGSAILSEIPEIFGAERLLMARARDRAVFEAIVGVVNDFKRYFLAHGEPVSENPSPGNIAGGITTLEEKSLGAVQKAGAARSRTCSATASGSGGRGLSLLEAPGNDAVSSTALAAAGATMILFTTGRGTPLGFPVPTVKIASNSELAERKKRLDRFRRRRGARRRLRAGCRSAGAADRRHRLRRARPRPSATASGRSRSGSAA